MVDNNRTEAHNSFIWDYPPHPTSWKGHEVEGRSHFIFWLFFILFVAALTKHICKTTRCLQKFPHQLFIILMAAGVAIFRNLIKQTFDDEATFEEWAKLLDPLWKVNTKNLLNLCYFPIVFQSAALVDVRWMRKRYPLMGWELLMFALIGFVLNMAIIGLIVRFMWSWNYRCAFSFANYISATDCLILFPILSSTKAIGNYISVEANVNMVTSFVLFHVFCNNQEEVQGTLFFFKAVFVSLLLGYFLYEIFIRLCKWFYDDYKAVMIVLTSFLTVGSVLGTIWKLSGSFLVFIFRLLAQYNKKSLGSPKVLLNLKFTLEWLSFVCETLLVAISTMRGTDYFMENNLLYANEVNVHKMKRMAKYVTEVILIYLLVMATRAVVQFIIFCILNKFGLNFDARKGAISIWAGVRHPMLIAIGFESWNASRQKDGLRWGTRFGDLVPPVCDGEAAIWIFGTVVLSLLFNASTIPKLMELLGVLEYTETRRARLFDIFKKMERFIAGQKLRLSTDDRFLYDADWLYIDDLFQLDESFLKQGDEFGNEDLSRGMTTCPECYCRHSNSPTKKELLEMAEVWRMHMLHLEGFSYLQQESSGLLSPNLAFDLYHSPQELMDVPGGYTSVASLMREAIDDTLNINTTVGSMRRKKGQVVNSNAMQIPGKTKLLPGNQLRTMDDRHQSHIHHTHPSHAFESGSSALRFKNPQRMERSFNKSSYSTGNFTVNMVGESISSRYESFLRSQSSESLDSHSLPSSPRLERDRTIRTEVEWEKQHRVDEAAEPCLQRVVHSLPFEIVIIALILANLGLLIRVEVRKSSEPCTQLAMIYAELAFTILFLLELILRILADKARYLPKSIWGLFDVIILALGVLSLSIDFVNKRWEGTEECKIITDARNGKTSRSDNTKYEGEKLGEFAIYLRFLRFFRIIRVLRIFMSEKWACVRRGRDNQIYVAHEIAGALVSSMKYVRQNFDESNYANDYEAVAACNAARMKANQFVATIFLCQLSITDPGINVSLRTRQASAEIVETLQNRVSTLHSQGSIDDQDFIDFRNFLNRKRYLIREMPSRLNVPNPRKTLRNIPWLHDDKMAQRYVVHQAELLHFEKGAAIARRGEGFKGIYLIVSGFVVVKGLNGLKRACCEQYGEESLKSEGDWDEDLPATFLRQLKESELNVMTSPEEAASDNCQRVLDMKFQFQSSGFVVNEINMVLPKFSICPVVCMTPVIAYFLTAKDVRNFIKRFSHRFENMEARIWHNLVSEYYLADESIDTKAVDRGFVAYLDRQITGKKSGEFVFDVDYVNVQRVFLLAGIVRTFLPGKRLGSTYCGPCEIPREELSLEFPVPSAGESSNQNEVFAKIFVIPHQQSSRYSRRQTGVTLNDIKAEAMRLLKEEPQHNSLVVDELLQLSLNKCSGVIDDGGAIVVEGGAIANVESSLLKLLKNRIKQVIHACFANEGEVITAKGVILNEGCLAGEGEQDEQKKMNMQLQKIDALLRIPYDDVDDEAGQSANRKSGPIESKRKVNLKAKIVGIS